MAHSNFNESQFRRDGQRDGTLKGRLYKFMESLGQRLKRDGLRLFFLVLANGFYLYLGGVVFYLLERNETLHINTRKQVKEIITTITNFSMDNNSNTTHEIHQKMSARNFTEEEIVYVENMLENYFEMRHTSERSKWTMMNSVFFASTVVTTIGYGNLAPVTGLGRGFCVIYAVFGIPLTLILLAKVGKILAKYINDLCGLVVKSLRRYFYPDYTYDSTDGETDLNAPVWLAMVLMTLFLFLDAIVFVFMEHWTFGNSLYFIFITLTTIGFGDIVPRNSEAVWFNVTFLYIGLAAVSITINLFIANITIQLRRHKDKFKIVQELESDLESEADCETTPLTSGIENMESNSNSNGNNNANVSQKIAESSVADSKPKRKTSRVRFQTDEK